MKKVLIANRGEIAIRIQRACDALGLDYVQVFSDPDALSLAVRRAKEAAPIGGQTAKDSYLLASRLIEVARERQCDAVHPGYGFLSENAEFAEAVETAGLTWIGPSPNSIRALGSKTTARELVTKHGVPVTPGSGGGRKDNELLEAAEKIGFPIILKAVAGGGGRGMRIARNRKELEDSIPRARAEALKNFASDDVYLEKFIEMPRHVEVQILGDKHGTVIHLGTRDCSAQRRHQKLVEEAPAPDLVPELREAIHDAAVRAAKSAGYFNAGTAEFLVKDGEFYFLEMNTRIQVEHPVTEEITGVDLVQLQFRVAMGEKLPITQKDVRFEGTAIEFRINAEDPAENFRPVTGTIQAISKPTASYIREEYGIEAGDEVTPFYDSMISKFIVKGASRDEALFRAFQALKKYRVEGLETTVPFHLWLLATESFQKGGIDIGFVEREFSPATFGALTGALYEDPEHRPGGESYGVLEQVMSGGAGVTIEVLHEPGGTFLAIPRDPNGERMPESRWVRSNSRTAAIEAVVGQENTKRAT